MTGPIIYLAPLKELDGGLGDARDKYNRTNGIVTDGQIRRYNQRRGNLHILKVKDIMTKKPISIDKDALAAKALAIMNSNKITSLCVFNKKRKLLTVGVVHIHHILQSNIS